MRYVLLRVKEVENMKDTNWVRRERPGDRPQESVCVWTFDAETDYWRSACGTTYFNENDPATIHKGVLFCHHCGNRISQDTSKS